MIARLRFRDPIERIEARLLELGIPERCVEKHIAALRSLRAKKAEALRRRMAEDDAFKHRVLRSKTE